MSDQVLDEMIQATIRNNPARYQRSGECDCGIPQLYVEFLMRPCPRCWHWTANSERRSRHRRI